MLGNKSNMDILLELDEYVYGHTEAKKALISLVNRSKVRHFQRWVQMIPDEFIVKPGKCLLIGPSGTGKTHLIRSLQKIVKFPLLVVDGSSFNVTGGSGGIKPEQLERLIKTTAKKYTQEIDCHVVDGVLDQMVVFVDEFDKIASRFDGSSSGKWQDNVQSGFLTLFDNHMALSGVSWIFAGAFSDLHKEDVKTGNIGFNKYDKKEARKEITDDAVIKFGILPEIVGRLNSIVSLDKLTKDDYYKILTDMLIPDKLLEMQWFGIDDSFIKHDEMKQIAEKASKSEQGVRYLARELNKIFLEHEFNYEMFRYE